MGRTLIVAEKPSQGREYALVLGVRGKGEGYLENDRYVVTWCYGHLLELERPETYMDLEKTGRRWGLNRLPVLPGIHEFRRTVKSGAYKQYQVIQRWLKSPEIDHVICATDADREGQLLFQEVWDRSGCTKPLSRLWISSLTKEAIKEGMARLLKGDSMAGLAAAGYGRAFADWDFGMNLTEGFTALFGGFDPVRKKPNVISMGRVQTPTLALVVEREWEIEAFIPQPYFEIKADFAAEHGEYAGWWFNPGVKGEAEARRIMDRRDGEAILNKVRDQPGKVLKVEKKEVQVPPSLLFDLTSLTVTASQRFGFAAEKVLQLAQSLYEKKAITYPRTDCVYLPADLLPKLTGHLQAVWQEPYTALAGAAESYGLPRGKRVINAISAHHAIIPTTERVNLERLSEGEQKLYDLIVRRFLAVWFPAARFEQTEVITEVVGEKFRTKGKVLLAPGWKQVYGEENGEEKEDPSGQGPASAGLIPPLQVNEDVKVIGAVLEEKVTQPPKRFTQGELIKAMEGAGKQIDDEVLRQQLKGKGLGTVATRPAILESLLERGYMIQEQKSLKPTEKGCELIRLIRERLPRARLLISPEMTGQMEFDLARVERGELTLNRYLEDVEEAIRSIIIELRSFETAYGKLPLAFAPPKGRRGRLGEQGGRKKTGPATEKGKGEKSRGKRQSASEIQAQTDQGRPDGESAGKSKVEGKQDKPSIPAGSKGGKEGAEALGACPRCGGNVIEGKKGYGCANWRLGCSFVVWKNPICAKVITPAQIKSLLKRGRTPLIKGFKSKAGKAFSAYLVWDDPNQGKVKFEFEKRGND